MKLILILFGLFFSLSAFGQLLHSEEGMVTFFSSAPLEDIKAFNRQGKSIFNLESNEIAFKVPIKGFQFNKSLMKKHFNENFMESEQYPNATFEGKVHGFSTEELGKQTVTAKGDLTIHGVTQAVEIEGIIVNLTDRLRIESNFLIRVKDYNISIPKIFFKNIAEVIEVDLNFHYQ